ncbi:hypothetical protein NDA16_001023 [Ustilago loliicola]|nr:hypothetical protein NDA16_001023 [Ustilago loliicola]
MPYSLATKLCAALILASGLVGTLAADDSHQHNYVRSPKHSRRAHNSSEASSSNLIKRRPTYSGRATYYAAGLGACGNYNSDSDFIVALNAAQYGNLGQRSSWCGRTIAVTYNGNTQYAQVQDACPSCPYGGLDMSEGLFKAFASTDLGFVKSKLEFGRTTFVFVVSKRIFNHLCFSELFNSNTNRGGCNSKQP